MGDRVIFKGSADLHWHVLNQTIFVYTCPLRACRWRWVRNGSTARGQGVKPWIAFKGFCWECTPSDYYAERVFHLGLSGAGASGPYPIATP